MKFKLVVFVLLLALIMMFVYQNSAPVALQFVKWQYPVPLALMLLCVLATGIVLGMGTVLRRQSYNKKKKALKESARQPSAEEAVSPETADKGSGRDHPAESVEENVQATTMTTGGEIHEQDNSDYRGDSRLR